jgi:hypothetical protein
VSGWPNTPVTDHFWKDELPQVPFSSRSNSSTGFDDGFLPGQHKDSKHSL